jgi:glutamyl-tRNA reductase
LHQIKEKELIKQSKKLANFNEEQAEIISNKIIQKITNHFVSHLKNENTNVDESIELIGKMFNL